jgi:adenosylhomocysteine nucleosidase
MADARGERESANEGFIQLGGTVNAGGIAVGRNAEVSVSSAPKRPAPRRAAPDRTARPARRDVGVITVLPAEMRAVLDVLKEFDGYGLRTHPDGPRFHEAVAPTSAGPVRVVATQTAEPGQRSVIPAFHALQRAYRPAFVLLVGIAGGVHPEVRPGDVVIATEAVYYDARKETADGALRRGRSFAVPSVLQHAVNAFATDLDQPVTARGSAGFRVHVGPIGTGEAVVADRASVIRDYLRRYSDKVLAVETEAGGLAQAYHESGAEASGCRGWLTVRGISDLADKVKDDRWHGLASRNAATVLGALLPYLAGPAAPGQP